MNSDSFTELVRCASSPWHFLTTHVQTQDPTSGARAYPDYPYLQTLIEDAQTHRYLLVPKSRQMMVTWSMVALTVWRAMFHRPGDYLFLSRNERCAEELLDRARFILEHLPAFMQPRRSADNKSELAFAGLNSRLISLPATPDGPRMYSPTSVFWDEMAFTPFDSQIWTALQPALLSGGSFVGVSSSGGAHNLFARLVSASHPVLRGGKGGASSQTPSITEEPRSESPPAECGATAAFPPAECGGIKGGSDASFPAAGAPNLFFIHRIHYSQHPERNEQWRAQASLGLSQSQWEREQEISFDSADDLVYAEFDPVLHILKEEFHPRKEWPLFRSIDFGYRKPFVLWLQQLPSGEFVVFSEWEGRDATTDAMYAAMTRTDLLFDLSESAFRFTACDPAGAHAQDSGISPVDYLARQGIKLRHRPSRILPGIERVKAALRDATGRVSLFISPRCRKLILDIHRYKWNAAADEPLKDGDSDHSLDALRYFFVNLDAQTEREPATPRFAKW